MWANDVLTCPLPAPWHMHIPTEFLDSAFVGVFGVVVEVKGTVDEELRRNDNLMVGECGRGWLSTRGTTAECHMKALE